MSGGESTQTQLDHVSPRTTGDGFDSDSRDVEKVDDGEITGSGRKERQDDEVPSGEVQPTENGASSMLQRVLSRATSVASVDPGPPPDGGLVAWTQAFCGHLVVMNTWGFITSFGVFQAYYATLLAPRTLSAISWIGSLQIFLLFFIGTFAGRLTDAGYFKPVLVAGSALITAGVVATSFCHTYWQFLLAQGVCVGLGNGLVFCPALALVSTYFHRRRALAIGVAACGSATGGLIYPSMVRQLLPRAGFAWSVRAIAFVVLATQLVCVVLMRTRIRPRRSGQLVEWSAFRELEYTFYAMGTFFTVLGLYFTFYYASSFSKTQLKPPLSYADSLNLLLVLNGVGAFGRLSLNFAADRLGVINLFIPCIVATAVCMFGWIAVDTPGGMYAWSVFYGFSAGGIQSLFPAGLSSLTADPRKQGTRMGMTFTIISFAVLTGPPIAGAIVTSCGGRYYGAQAFAGATMVVGLGFMVAVKVVWKRRTGGRWLEKV